MSAPDPSVPITPARPSQQPASFQSTPLNQGLASRDAEVNNHTCAHFAMYLEHDLQKSSGEVRMEDFCTHILRTYPTDAPSTPFDFSKYEGLKERYGDGSQPYATPASIERAKAIINKREFKSLQAEYAKQKKEIHRYGPFVNLVNFILKELRGGEAKDDDLLFVRNDPQRLESCPGYLRSPDVVAIRAKDKEAVRPDSKTRGTFLNRCRSDEWDERGPHLVPFHAREILFFVEFEKESNQSKKQKTAGRGSPSTSQLAISSTGVGSKRSQDADASTTSKRQRKNSPFNLTISNTNSGQSDLSPSLSQDGILDRDVPMQGHAYDLKCADYAAGLFSYGGLRNFVFGMLINGNELRLRHYGRSLIIPTEGFNFLENSVLFVVILEGLMKLDNKQLGISQALDMSKVEDPNTNMYGGAELTLNVDNEEFKVRLSSKEKPRIQEALIGRGSFLAKIDLPRLHPHWEQNLVQAHEQTAVDPRVEHPKTSTYVVKINSIPKTRTAEYKFVDFARKQAKIKGPQFLWVLYRLPLILHWEELKNLDEQSLRAAFMLSVCLQYEHYELRTSNVLIAEELYPISGIKNPYELLRIYRDCIQAHKWLIEDPKILHRDVSFGNIMYRVIWYNGAEWKIGVLNDYDLAIFIHRDQPNSSHRQRTGTQPFMALDLLQKDNTRHWPRHDLESFFYTYLYHIFGANDTSTTNLVAMWGSCDFVQLFKEKTTFWSGVFDNEDSISENFLTLLKMTVRLYNFFQDGMRSWDNYRTRHRFDPESLKDLPPYNLKTLDGHITHNRMIEFFSEEIEEIEKSGLIKDFVVGEPFPVEYSADYKKDDKDDKDPDNDKLVEEAIIRRRAERPRPMMPLPQRTLAI